MVTTTAPAKATKAQLRESLAERDAVLTMLMERLPELEAQLQEDGWNRIEGAGEREFSREGLRRIIAMSRLMFLKNPLINRGVMVQTLYVWGQGVTIQGRDEDVDELVQDFLNDPKNKVELTSHQARTLKEIELQVTGNLFFCLFPSRVTGKVRIRTIPVEEIDDIICNPEDAKDPWFYKRVWSESRMDPANGNMTTKTVTAFYPDWRHTPKDKPSHFGSAPVMWDTPVYHVKVGGFDTMRFGVPETYQALDWARAYKSMLEDWATITRALSRFAWNVTTPGGTRGIAAAKSKLATTEGNGSGANSRETNPPPTTASTFIGSNGAALNPVRTAGATTGPEEGRQLKLMVAAALGLPETFFGDADVGNNATAKTLDRPTELKFADRRTLWRDVFDDILQYRVERGALANAGNLRATVDTDEDGEQVVVLAGDVDRHIEISMPPILEHDVAAAVEAIVKAATLGGQAPAGTMDDRTLVRLLLTALGVEGAPELLDLIAPEGGGGLMDEMRQQKAAAAEAMAASTAQRPPGAPPEQQQTESFVEALREVREAVRLVVSD